MNLVDSSGWLEYFADSNNARFFAPVIENTSSLIVPTICLYEVFKKIIQQKDENSALQAIAHMRIGNIINLDVSMSVSAAKISISLKMPMADSIILATARSYKAIIYTQDCDFKGLQSVKYFKK
ncbi:MAG: type II toxin-antitoxin system VapC family toxin [bacterium]